ncbi:tetratricopeptide repeat protein [bacterium]|nr:tetratricopeptide repeat protein [bacterium]
MENQLLNKPVYELGSVEALQYYVHRNFHKWSSWDKVNDIIHECQTSGNSHFVFLDGGAGSGRKYFSRGIAEYQYQIQRSGAKHYFIDLVTDIKDPKKILRSIQGENKHDLLKRLRQYLGIEQFPLGLEGRLILEVVKFCVLFLKDNNLKDSPVTLYDAIHDFLLKSSYKGLVILHVDNFSQAGVGFPEFLLDLCIDNSKLGNPIIVFLSGQEGEWMRSNPAMDLFFYRLEQYKLISKISFEPLSEKEIKEIFSKRLDVKNIERKIVKDSTYYSRGQAPILAQLVQNWITMGVLICNESGWSFVDSTQSESYMQSYKSIKEIHRYNDLVYSVSSVHRQFLLDFIEYSALCGMQIPVQLIFQAMNILPLQWVEKYHEISGWILTHSGSDASVEPCLFNQSGHESAQSFMVNGEKADLLCFTQSWMPQYFLPRKISERTRKAKKLLLANNMCNVNFYPHAKLILKIARYAQDKVTETELESYLFWASKSYQYEVLQKYFVNEKTKQIIKPQYLLESFCKFSSHLPSKQMEPLGDFLWEITFKNFENQSGYFSMSELCSLSHKWVEIKFALKKYEEVIVGCVALLQWRQCWYPFYYKGFAHLTLDELPEAMEMFAEIIERWGGGGTDECITHNGLCYAYFGMGTVHSERKQYDDACSFFKHAIGSISIKNDMDKQSLATIYSTLDELLRKQGNFEEAEIYINKANSILDELDAK